VRFWPTTTIAGACREGLILDVVDPKDEVESSIDGREDVWQRGCMAMRLYFVFP
jgi:hypothetical protein